jgi:GNAT superfamily N-acetyltransferase
MTDPATVTLRPIEPRDAEAAARLHIAVWEEAYDGLVPARMLAERRAGLDERIERWRGIIDGSPATTTVADHAGELVGFASVGHARDDDMGDLEELWALYVRAAWWGRGLGHRLLAAVLDGRPAYLWVLDGNERGIAFYRRQGFGFDGATQQEDEGLHRRMVR